MSKKKKPTMREKIAELEAELAGCESTIEELVMEVEKWKSKADLEGEARWRAECERDDWKVTAQSLAKTLEEVNEKYFDLLGDSEIPGMRNAARKLVRRALEVVR